MTPSSPEILRDRGKSLEDEFFRREDRRLMERLKELKTAEATREALAQALGITRSAVLQELTELGVSAETVAALFTVPLVEVAWADGTLDAKGAPRGCRSGRSRPRLYGGCAARSLARSPPGSQASLRVDAPESRQRASSSALTGPSG